jgi:hypothetical protein
MPVASCRKSRQLEIVIAFANNLFLLCAESKHVKSGFISGLFNSMFRGLQYREMQGDFHQQGGAFLLGPGLFLVSSTFKTP